MSFYDISKLPPIPVFDISKLPPLKDTGKNIVIKVIKEKEILPQLPQALKINLLPPKLDLLPIKNQQYTSELHLAPLSPRLSRNKSKIPKVVTKKVVPKVLEKTETCCICYDEEIPTSNLLTCKHPVCGECTGQLQKAECPMCKKYLEGPLVTDLMIADIINREEQAKNEDITANYLAGIYLREHPHANPEEVYDRYRN